MFATLMSPLIGRTIVNSYRLRSGEACGVTFRLTLYKPALLAARGHEEEAGAGLPRVGALLCVPVLPARARRLGTPRDPARDRSA